MSTEFGPGPIAPRFSAGVPAETYRPSKGRLLRVDFNVTAGPDVVFACALLRSGTPEELAADPTNRLRLTTGLRKEAGRWVVSHEHHSFPDKS